MDWLTFLTTAGASGLIGLVLGKAIEWYNIWQKASLDNKKQQDDTGLKESKQKAETSIPINDQAVGIYREIATSLRADMNKLLDNMKIQDGLLLNCREEKLTLKAEKVAALAERDLMARELVLAKERLTDLEQRMTKQEGKHHDEALPQPSPELLSPGGGGAFRATDNTVIG